MDSYLGDIVRVCGRRETFAVIMEESTCPDTHVAIPAAVARNISVYDGETVKLVKESNVAYASKVELAVLLASGQSRPAADAVTAAPRDFFRDAYRPITKGDRFVMQGGIEVKVTKLEPGTGGIVAPETTIAMADEPLDRDAEDALERATLVKLQDVGGLPQQVAYLRGLLQRWMIPSAAARELGMPRPVPSGIILHGPSGCGKTRLCRALAMELSCFVFVVNGPELLDKYAGASEDNLRKAFAEATKNAPSLFIFDQLDDVFKNDTTDAVERRLIGQLESLLDGFMPRDAHVFVIATARDIDAIDAGLKRAGRLEEHIRIGLPDAAGRADLLRIHMRGIRVGADVNIPALAAVSESYSGAQLASACKFAVAAAAEEAGAAPGMSVMQRHFMSALQRVRGDEGRAGAPTSTYRAAIGLYEELLAENTRQHGVDHAITMATRLELAALLRSVGEHARAAPLLAQILHARRATDAGATPFADLLATYAACLRELNEHAGAVAALREALRIREANADALSTQLRDRQAMASALRAQGALDAAIAELRTCWQACRTSVGATTLEVAAALADALHAADDDAAGEAILRETLENARVAGGNTDKHTRACTDKYTQFVNAWVARTRGQGQGANPGCDVPMAVDPLVQAGTQNPGGA